MDIRVLETIKEGGYALEVPSLPGSVSKGEKADKAIVNIREAIGLERNRRQLLRSS